jgi:hypothetical protein
MEDRIKQGLVKLAIEPQWEAKFEPNSYGFRPARSCQDAVGQIFNASSIASHPDCMDLGSTKLRCRKIQIYPSPELNKMWRQWLAACRYCFNQAMAWLKDNGKLIAKRKLRNIIMQSDLPDWVKQSPCHIRQNGDIGRITRLCQHLDNLMSRISQATGRKRQSMRKAAGRMRNRIRNLIDEAHRQIAHYLTSNYKVIFLPTFETSQMVAKSKRKIRSKTARQMLGWAHYRFSQVLANQAQLTQTRLIEGSEAYTSKTCTKCGHIHTTLGGSKVFKCPSCGHKL